MAIIARTARLETPYRPLLSGGAYGPMRTSVIADDVSIGEYAIIGNGVVIADGSIIDHFCIVEQDSTLGQGVLLCYRAHVCAESKIGDRCIIGGFIGERATVGAGSRVFGSLVHNHPRKFPGWDDDASMGAGPILGDDVFVGFGAVIVGGVNIGTGAYIGANAVVRTDVASGELVGAGEIRL